MELNGKNLIGSLESNQGGVTFSAINPVTKETLQTTFTEATTEEIDMAFTKASQAFQGYRKLPSEDRATFLEQIATEIENLGDTLIERCNLETALGAPRLNGERGRTCNQLRLFAKVVREGSWVGARIDTAVPDRKPLPKADIRMMHIALGPVTVFGASNFPLAFSVAGGDTASALAAGCPVVVKAHPAHPGTSELVGRAILSAAKKTNMPEGVFSLLQGKSHQSGQTMVGHPLAKAVGFTGSYQGGKALYDAVQQRKEPIPVYAEMGSVNPVFLLPGALAERGKAIGEGLGASINLGVGQFCTNPGMVVKLNSDSDEFEQYLTSSIQNAPHATMLTEGISKAYQKGVSTLVHTTGVSVMAEGNTGDNPSVVFQTDMKTAVTREEISKEVFGPSSVVIKCDSTEELFEFAKNLEGHLTATVHATKEDLEGFKTLFDILEQKVGRIIINGFPTGVEVCDSMIHGGPFPATSDSRSTSVGTLAIMRFARPISYQDYPQDLLPDALKDNNPLGIKRMLNGDWE